MSIILLLYLARPSLAQANSTGLEGWQWDGNDRSSWDILWTCLSTIFACTWTALHLPVTKYDGLRGINKGDIKAFSLIAAIIAPEMLALKAVQEALEVKLMLKRCNSAQPGITAERGSGHLSPEPASTVAEIKVDPEDPGAEHPEPASPLAKIVTGREERQPGHSSPEPVSTVAEVTTDSNKEDPACPSPGPINTVTEITTATEKRVPRNSSPGPASTVAEIPSRQCLTKWTFVQGFCIRMHGLALQTKDDWVYVVRPAIVVPLIEAGVINQGNLRTSEIKDRGKADSFAKAFTLLQGIWVLFNVIARPAYALPISPLEISTVAYVACALITYAAWWHKPKDMDTPIMIHLPYDRESDEMPLQVRSILDANRSVWIHLSPSQADSETPPLWKLFWTLFRLAWTRAYEHLQIPKILGPSKATRVDEEAREDQSSTTSTGTSTTSESEDGFEENKTVFEQFTIDFLCFISGLVFCGIHIAAWNFTFPTTAEQTAWRTFSVTAFALCWPLLIVADLDLWREWHTHGNKSPVPEHYQNSKKKLNISVVLWLIYAIARGGNLVLMFTSLRALPSGSYTAISWLASIPHI